MSESVYKLKGSFKTKKRKSDAEKAKRLSEKGKTVEEIVKILKVNHTTVCIYLGLKAYKVGIIEATERKIRRIENLITGSEQQKKALEKFLKKYKINKAVEEEE